MFGDANVLERLNRLAGTYYSVVAAGREVRGWSAPELEQRNDEQGQFAEIRNSDVIAPRWSPITGQRAPWPSGPVGRLMWLLDNGAELWLPSVDEQQRRWDEVHGERLRNARHNRHQLQALAALGGGPAPATKVHPLFGGD